jgi:hypothetical protein
MELQLELIFPKSRFTRIKNPNVDVKLDVNMKYVTIRKTRNDVFVFLDECSHFGNVTTFIRKKGFIINEKNINECLKETISISVDKSYFNDVELYKLD